MGIGDLHKSKYLFFLSDSSRHTCLTSASLTYITWQYLANANPLNAAEAEYKSQELLVITLGVRGAGTRLNPPRPFQALNEYKV